MKILIFSDTHFSQEFSQKKLDHLANVIKSVDKVIINGDFWDGYRWSFSDFLDSRWSQLFPLLKTRWAIYLYGNHDLPEFNDTRTRLFSSDQDLYYREEVGDKVFHFTHGHTFSPSAEIRHPWLLKKARVINFGGWIERFGYRLFGFKIVKYRKRKYNKIQKNWWKEELKDFKKPDRHILVCGHSHVQEDSPAENYINAGFNKFNYCQYLIIDNKGNTKLYSKKFGENS